MEDRRILENHSDQEKLIYVVFLALLVWLPIPLGSNREWAWSLFEIASSFLLVWVVFLIVSRRISDHSVMAHMKWLLLLFVASVLVQLFQVYPIGPEVLALVSPKHLELASTLGTDGMTLSIDKDSTIEGILKNLSYVSTFFLALLLLSDRRRIRWTLLAIAVGGVFQSVLAISQWISLSAMGVDVESVVNASGTFVNKNHFAAYLNMVVACLIGLILFEMNSENSSYRGGFSGIVGSRNVFIAFLTIVVFALVITRSRGAGLAFVVSLMSLFLCIGMNSIGRERFGLKIMLFALLSIAIAVSFGHKIITDRIVSAEKDISSRTEIWDLSGKLIQDFPIFGVGVGNYATIIPLYEDKNMGVFINHAHNDYIELLAEQGIVGLSIFLLIILICSLYAIRTILNTKDSMTLIVTGVGIFGVTSMLVHAVVDFNFNIPANAAYFYVFLALMVCNSHRARPKKKRHGRSELNFA